MGCDGFEIRAVEQLQIRTPVGPITGISQGTTPSELDAIRAISGQLSALLAPFLAVFEIVETVQLVVETIQTIPEALASIPPQPGKILDKLSELQGKLGLLVNLLPQSSAIKLAADVVVLIERNLRAIRHELVDLQSIKSSTEDVAELSIQLESEGEIEAAARLDVTVSCQEQLLTERVNALSAGNAGIDDLVGVVNTLIGLIPGNIPQIPTLGTIPTDLELAIELVDTTLELLTPVARALSTV
jgi:hypothetical protein